MGLKLEDVTPGAQLAGVTGDSPVTVVAAAWIGSNALRLAYRTGGGRLEECLLYRDHEPWLALAKAPAAYEFHADATTFKLAAKALRIRMAGRFDPMLAVHTSDLEPLRVSTDDQATVTSLEGTMVTGNGRTARYSWSPVTWAVCW